MNRNTDIDTLLDGAVRAQQIPGVVALVADRSGVIYEGIFGRSALPAGEAMTSDTVFAIASMTKTVTAVAAMQLVEQGRLALDAPAGEILPQLANRQVLVGFDSAGEPLLRPAKLPITLRHLLTHISGFGYDTWHPNLFRFVEKTGLPAVRTGKLASLDAPLVFDPGERWLYGINIEWAGRMVEAVSGQSLEAYFRKFIFEPLGMTETGYELRPDQLPRLAKTHRREIGGSLTALEYVAPQPREFFQGGGGLYSTGADYLTLLRMLLNGGSHGNTRLLRPETVMQMGENHIGAIQAGILKSMRPEFSEDVELFPGMPKGWGLSFLINSKDAPGGRAAGSLAWAGLFNTHFWIDPKRGIAAVFMTQVLPFGDRVTMGLLEAFERAAYEAID